MEGQQIDPCVMGLQYGHIVLAVFTGINMLLTTWLAKRARRRDNKEAQQNGDLGQPNR